MQKKLDICICNSILLLKNIFNWIILLMHLDMDAFLLGNATKNTLYKT